MMTRTLPAVAFVAAIAPPALATEAPAPAADAACAGVHSLARPVPERCLEGIDTDRPHQTDTPHVVPAGHAQFESAVVAVALGGAVGTSSGDRSAHVLLANTAYKFGVVTGAEVEVALKHADYVPDRRRFVSPGPLSLRAKLNFLEQRGALPTVTFVPWVFVPMDRSQIVRAGPLLFWGWELPLGFELEVNAGVFFNAKPAERASGVLASALTYTVLDGVKVFLDGYATGRDFALGTGVLWAFARNMQIDAGTYIGVLGEAPRATPFLGLSVRR